MATNAASGKRKKQIAPAETDVILIVKGAGEQAEDDHLNLFLRGFWPAVKALDKRATIKQVTSEAMDQSSSPHNEGSGSHKHITEIIAEHGGKQKRIWLKESYWEYETLPSTALSNLSKEWQMSSHVFANMFQDLFFTRDTKERRRLLTDPRKMPDKEFLEPTWWDRVGAFVSYLFLFLLVLLPLVVAPYIEPVRMSEFLTGIFPSAITSDLAGLSGFLGFAFALVIAFIWALAPTWELSKMTRLRFERQNNEYMRRVPGLPNWSLVLLVLLLLTFPLSYLSVLLCVLTTQVAFLFSRRILWKFRNFSNSDAYRAKEYYGYKSKKEGRISERMGIVNEAWILRLPFSPLFYRYFIYLVLPVGFVITILAGFLKWTRILGGFGEALDGLIKFMLVGYMDDVVNYATDPAQAHRVRSVVMEDIKRFHDLNEGREVQRIHVVAHSQGTPITFETLFHFIDKKYQEKIYTYVTLGSVLSYYHQARGILDLVYYNRFKMPIRDDQFPQDFKWMNFWNFTDPITEFYGLDEYNWFNGDWKDDKKTIPMRGYTSPVNIRTRSSLSKNHGEYWDNLDKFQRPFAKRVLGELRPEEWDRENIGEKKLHHLGVLLLSPLIPLVFASVGFGLYSLLNALGILQFVSVNFNGIYSHGYEVYETLFPPEAGSEPGMFQKLFDPTTLMSVWEVWRNILDVSLVVVGIWAIFDWAGQLWRTYKLGRETNPKPDMSRQ